MKCPKCSSQTAVKYGRARGRQRYKCKNCGCQFTVERPRARSLEEKLFAMSLLVSGLSMTAVAKALGVSVQSIMRWKNSGLIISDKVVKALRVRKVLRSGKVKIVKDNEPQRQEVDDFQYGDVYSLETRLPSGIRVDIIIKRKAKNITK
ncbi:MAG: hypothetical protein ACI4TE_08645 [Alphaproteobacteria bacterium]